MKLPRVLAVLTVITLLVAALGCSTTPAEVVPTPNIDATVEARAKELVASQPTATPHPTYTPNIPPDFILFTDESSLFSIQHPSQWELDLAQMVTLEKQAKGFVHQKNADAPLEGTKLVFFAVDPNTRLHVSVGLVSLPASTTLDEIIEEALTVPRQILSSWRLINRSRVTFGRSVAVIIDSDYDLSEVGQGTGRIRTIKLMMVEGEAGWIVSCFAGIEPTEQNLETCYAVVSSFRILR